jgi:hypothetical protein
MSFAALQNHAIKFLLTVDMQFFNLQISFSSLKPRFQDRYKYQANYLAIIKWHFISQICEA